MAYINRSTIEAELVALDTHLVILEDDEKQLLKKGRRFKVAAVLLAAAVFVAMLGSMVEYAQGDGSGGKVCVSHDSERRTAGGPSSEPRPKPHRQCRG
ncbi:hypothetical protein GCM10027080_00580 [Pedococcus soli]